MNIRQCIRNGRYLLGVLLMIIVMAVVSACSSASVTPGPTQGMAELTEEQLKNGKYELPNLGAFQLKDGSYEQKYGEGATQVNRAGFEIAALGDLNNDGAKDAAVVLWWQGGGSGTFFNLVAVINRNGTPQQVAAEPLGDRVKVKSLSIKDGNIMVDMVTQGPNDPMCCPSQEVRRSFKLQGEKLILIPSTS